MIARITGKVLQANDNCILVDVGGLAYEVFLPATVRERFEAEAGNDGFVSFITYHYHQVEPSRSTPVLIGFFNEIEKDFFEVFITVSGIGPRAALKALNKPISQIAKAIDEGNIGFLTGLPGIGQQRAREIIAKLQNKVARFGLIRDNLRPLGAQVQDSAFSDEALAVLLQLEYKKPEALSMIKKAMDNAPQISSTEELLNEVYRQRKAQ